MSAAYMHLRLDFIMEANTMNRDQTAPFDPYCLQSRLLNP